MAQPYSSYFNQANTSHIVDRWVSAWETGNTSRKLDVVFFQMDLHELLPGSVSVFLGQARLYNAPMFCVPEVSTQRFSITLQASLPGPDCPVQASLILNKYWVTARLPASKTVSKGEKVYHIMETFEYTHYRPVRLLQTVRNFFIMMRRVPGRR